MPSSPIALALHIAAHHANVPIALLWFGCLRIGPEEIAALLDLRKRAADAPVYLSVVRELTKTPDGRALHIEAMSRLTVEIPHGFLVTYSIEVGHPAGPCRRLTMSRENATPTEEAMGLVARELGFVGNIASHFWSEPACLLHDERGRTQVSNLVQPLGITDAPGNA